MPLRALLASTDRGIAKDCVSVKGLLPLHALLKGADAGIMNAHKCLSADEHAHGEKQPASLTITDTGSQTANENARSEKQPALLTSTDPGITEECVLLQPQNCLTANEHAHNKEEP